MIESISFSEAVQWWEEWQLRILVLTSLFLQCFLFFAGILRKLCIPSWFRFSIWLAYLGSDAVVIYALATLFNRNKEQEWASMNRNSTNLQVLWPPILLVHLGDQNGITAYNIEDNELWRRHVVRTVSQVTVAIYVFFKSGSGDGAILTLGTILFFFGIFKCILKPWDLKRASINSLVGSSGSEETRRIITSLQVYVRAAAYYFQFQHGSDEDNEEEVWKPYAIFADMSPPYSDRLKSLKLMVRNGGEEAHHLVQCGLSITFDRLYTKETPMRLPSLSFSSLLEHCNYLRVVAASSLISVITVFHKMGAYYNATDVIITFALLSCILILEYIIGSMMVLMNILSNDSRYVRRIHRWFCHQGNKRRPWPDQVAQYNLIGYLARNKRHSWFRRFATLLRCRDNIDQLWCMKPSKSSPDITKLLHGYLAQGWKHHIKDLATFRAFNDNRGHWTLDQEGCGGSLGWSLRRPFDESVLLWHLATDFCFHRRATHSSHEAARRCKEISNYMAYLLFVNPEMLMTGARRSLFREAYREIKRVLKEENPPLDGGPENAPPKPVDEKKLTLKILEQVMVTVGSGAPHDARWLAHYLMELCSEGEDKMWRVIQGVWVEMLCFSAGSCRGYLHAKSLGKGGEYLSYVWLLMSYMGMETLAERMQRMEVQGAEEEEAAWCPSRRPYIPSNDRGTDNTV